jgi:hypothetical protein
MKHSRRLFVTAALTTAIAGLTMTTGEAHAMQVPGFGTTFVDDDA